MLFNKCLVACLCITTAISLASCNTNNQNLQSTTESPNSSATPDTSTSSPVSSNAEAEVEKVKPAPGTGNIQGKVFYNSKPVGNIEVKLCETFSQYVGGCSGETFTARTDKNGEFVIANLKSQTYGALLARVFDTNSYVFATSGIAGISSSEYVIPADKTLFVPPTNLFKGDLKLLNPKAGEKTSTQNLELKWEPYPEAAYYKFSIYAEDVKVQSPYINERIDGTTFSIDQPLEKGIYRWQVEAYNGEDEKLAESSSDIKFTIN